MIRRTHGFGVVDAAGVALQFDQSPNYNQFGTSTFKAAPAGPGAGRAFYMWFQTFGAPAVIDIFDPQAFWCVGMDARQGYATVTDGSGPGQQNLFFEFADASVAIAGLQFEVDGTISIQDLIHNVEIARTTASFPVGSWPGYIELRTSGWGSTVTFQLYIADVLAAHGTAALSQTPDRAIFRSAAVTVPGFGDGGAAFANVYILDGQGVAPWNDRLGPVRVSTISPSADASGRWAITPTSNASAYLSVNDLLNGTPGGDPNGSPDGDNSFLTPNAFGSAEFFQFIGSPCYGLILGVMATYCFRGTSGTAGLQAMLLQSSSVYNLGVLNVSGSYKTAQQFVGLSKTTGNYFNDAELSSSYWGALTNSSLDLRLTQLYLEKIVSLRNVTYGCGGSNYSF
jgi:hypothetical protein